MLHLHFSWSYRLLNHLEKEKGKEKSSLLALPPAPSPPFLPTHLPSLFMRLPSGKGAQERLHSRGSTQTVALYSLNTHRSLSEVKGLSGWHIVYERKRERREANVHQGDYSISRAQMEAGK